ncbi:MAG: hypothetical protein MUC49_17050 [Raineya sp.]|jgi:hypothetical protein|nr:hypothetical protein [Raineya sp.]
MHKLKNALVTISNISFLLIFVAFFAGKYGFQQARTLQIVAWVTFALVAVLEGFTASGKAKIFYLITMLGVAVASMGILFKSMAWEGYAQMLLVGGITSVGGSIILFLFNKKADPLTLKALIIGAICFFLYQGTFL